jgi:ElaB/YqjD/DUF883 family membrane-anchored ribosome-binding protein
MNMNTNANNTVSAGTNAGPSAGTGSAERAAHNKVDAAADGAHKAVDWAADTAQNARDSLSDTGHDLKETQERWLALTREYVQENPVTAVGIAVASGFLLSRILRSK